MAWMNRLLAAVLACLLGQVAPVHAQSADPAPARPDVEAAVARVQQARTQAYVRILAEYDTATVAAPSDPVIAVERCRFMSRFTDEDYDWVERAPDDLERCIAALHERWPKDPHVRLFDLDQLYGEDVIERGEPWLEDAKAWPPELRRELFSKLSGAYGSDDKIRGGDLAVQAAELGDPGSVAAAVERLAGAGEAARARALLRGAKPATTSWAAAQRIDAALQLPDPKAALEELRRYGSADFTVQPIPMAKACLRAGDIACARKALEGGARNNTDVMKQLRFDVAIASSNMPAAVDAIDIAGGKGIAVALERFAVVLGKAPAMLFTGKLMLIAFVFACVLVAIALFPALLLLPVHYRGLVRRVHGKPTPALFERIGLRHAWLGGAIILCLPLLVALAIAPRTMPMLLGGDGLPPADELMRLTLWASIAGLLLLIPVARKFGLPRLLGDREAWRQNWWRILVAWGVLIVIAVGLSRINSHADTSTMQTRMIQSLVDGGRTRFGAPWVLMLVALIVPVYEELVFRGLLLGGMSRHISFGWANAVQATLFAFVHNDSPRFLFYLALGLLSGWLVKRSRSLGPSIALHGANNALATAVRMAIGATTG